MKLSLLNIMLVLAILIGPTLVRAKTKPQSSRKANPNRGFKPTADPPSVLPNPNGSQTPVQYGLLGTPRGPCYALGNNGQLTAYVPPNLPQYLWRYNEGIPNLQGSCQGAQPQPIRLFYPRQFLNHEPHEDEDRDLMQQMLPGLMSSMGGMGGGGGGGYGGGNGYGGGGGYSPGFGGGSPTNPLLTGTGLIEGLCTAANVKHEQNTRGYCQTLKEALAAPCMQEYLNRLRDHPPFGVEAYCPNYNTIKNDPTNHILFWQQVLSALAMEESGWDNTKSNTVGENSHGIFMLKNGDAANGCLCQGLNVADAHSNIKCGATIAMKHIAQDGVVAGGHAGTAGARGMARYYGPTGDNQSGKRSKIQQKAANWCKSAQFQRPLESGGAQPEPGAAPPASAPAHK